MVVPDRIDDNLSDPRSSDVYFACGYEHKIVLSGRMLQTRSNFRQCFQAREVDFQC